MPLRLKILIGIFFAQLAILFILELLELLGLPGDMITRLLFLCIFACIVFAGAWVRTVDTLHIFVDGHKMTPFVNAITLALICIGIFGYIQWPGQIYAQQLDGFIIPLGVIGGVTLMGLLFAPHLRRANVLTCGEFLQERFSSRLVLILAIIVSISAIIPVLSAQFMFVSDLAARYTNIEDNTVILLVLAGITVPLILGVMRAAGWMQMTMAVIVSFGIVLPIFWWSLELTGLPLPHLAASAVLEATATLQEDAMNQGIITRAQTTWLNVSGLALTPIQAGTTIIALALGVCVFTPFLSRLNLTQTPAQASKTILWAVLLLSGFIIIFPIYAIFLRFQLVELINGVLASQVEKELPFLFEQPGGIKLCDAPLASLDAVIAACGDGSRLNANDFGIAPDMVLFFIPDLMRELGSNMPQTIEAMLACGALAALIAVTSACLITLSHHLAFDFYGKILARKAPMNRLIFLIRLSILISAGALYGILTNPAVKSWLWAPQELFVLGLTIAAGGLFPLYILAVWSRKAGAISALVAGIVGITITIGLIYIHLNESMGIFDLPILIVVKYHLEILFGVPLPVPAAGVLGALVGLILGWITAQIFPMRMSNPVMQRMGVVS